MMLSNSGALRRIKNMKPADEPSDIVRRPPAREHRPLTINGSESAKLVNSSKTKSHYLPLLKTPGLPRPRAGPNFSPRRPFGPFSTLPRHFRSFRGNCSNKGAHLPFWKSGTSEAAQGHQGDNGGGGGGGVPPRKGRTVCFPPVTDC